jgi:hypothetical protein
VLRLKLKWQRLTSICQTTFSDSGNASLLMHYVVYVINYVKSFWICEKLVSFSWCLFCNVCELLLRAYIRMALFIDFLNLSYHKMYEGSLYREDLNIMSIPYWSPCCHSCIINLICFLSIYYYMTNNLVILQDWDNSI